MCFYSIIWLYATKLTTWTHGCFLWFLVSSPTACYITTNLKLNKINKSINWSKIRTQPLIYNLQPSVCHLQPSIFNWNIQPETFKLLVAIFSLQPVICTLIYELLHIALGHSLKTDGWSDFVNIGATYLN